MTNKTFYLWPQNCQPTKMTDNPSHKLPFQDKLFSSQYFQMESTVRQKHLRRPYNLSELCNSSQTSSVEGIRVLLTHSQNRWFESFNYRDHVTLKKYNIVSVKERKRNERERLSNPCQQQSIQQTDSFKNSYLEKLIRRIRSQQIFSNQQLGEILRYCEDMKLIKQQRVAELLNPGRKVWAEKIKNSRIQETNHQRKIVKLLQQKMNKRLFEINLAKFRSKSKDYNFKQTKKKLVQVNMPATRKKSGNTAKKSKYKLNLNTKVEKDAFEQFVEQKQKQLSFRIRHEAEYIWKSSPVSMSCV